VDSAATTAAAVARWLAQQGLQADSGACTTTMLATDGAERFARVGSRFLGVPLQPASIEIVDL
jgi:glutamate racemase